MNTPIFDFISQYAASRPTRLHMPGHKGKGPLGAEAFDITEIKGADILYAAEGIIKESEDNASRLFGTAHSFYSAEGSTLSIKTMLSLAVTASEEKRPLVLAARNAHKAFLYAAAWLDFDIKWLMPSKASHLCTCPVTPQDVEDALASLPKKPCAVYITSPDYLGNMADIAGIGALCDEHQIPLLVDNAHGAYLRFLSSDCHPITLGATMCCDSAHKTLPVLTGGAYLHIAQKANPYFVKNARSVFSSFASTSPSSLILASLDLCNSFLSEEGRESFDKAACRLAKLKACLLSLGVTLVGNEPLKLTLYAPSIGFTGDELAELLRKDIIECDMADRECVVLMFSSCNTEEDFTVTEKALRQAVSENRTPFVLKTPVFPSSPVAMSPREAILARCETIAVEDALGRIAASPTVSCPPAIPITVSGEVITKEAIALYKHYHIDTVSVVL